MGFDLMSVGADPELLLFSRYGQPVSVEGKLGGTKVDPRPIPHAPGFSVQEDNVAAEFNIPPCKTPTEFANAIEKAIKYINSQLKKQGLVAKAIAAAHFDPFQLMTVHAQTLGCDPDYNAWTGEQNPRPKAPETLRTAAGHVHIGFNVASKSESILVAKACDLYLGIPSILASEKNERRNLYGKAGAFRYKPYGVEYRTLDNFWLTSRNKSKHVFSAVVEMMAELRNPNSRAELVEILDEYEEEIQTAINEHDKDFAMYLANNHSINLFPHD